MMKKVVFISVDKPQRWHEWHSGSTDSVYRSDFMDTQEDVDRFVEQIKEDFPDSNLSDGSCAHEYYIQYIALDFNADDEAGFNTLCDMMHGHGRYEDNKKYYVKKA